MSQMFIGVNTFEWDVENSNLAFDTVCQEGGGCDYVVCHMEPFKMSLADACDKAKLIAEQLLDRGLYFVANFEYQNFHDYDKCVGPDGVSWVKNENGCHRLSLPKEYIEALSSCGNFIGVMYDEFEHVIINRNLSLFLDSHGKINKSVFPHPSSNSLSEQEQLLGKQLHEYAEEIKKNGAPHVSGEHVFPVLFHLFAQNGITPNFKSQKESFSNIQFAIAAGAALEYQTPLWNCVDMWFHGKHPGHTPEEMYNNLVFAYYAGVKRVYVESTNAFTTKDENGQKQFNEWGKAFLQFTEHFRGRNRSYSALDYRPEIGIIRMDDSFWGQGAIGSYEGIHWENCLYGNSAIKPKKASHEWIHAFSVITQGDSGKENISWNRINLWSKDTPHRSFATMNSCAVFDSYVKYDSLTSLKLCFLCGESISEETMKAVQSRVREGMTVVTTMRYLPKEFHISPIARHKIFEDGEGKWIVTRSFTSSFVKKAVSSFLGRRGEIRLTFVNKTIRLRINRSGETFSILEE